MSRLSLRILTVPVHAMYRALMYTLLMFFFLGAMIFFADFLQSYLGGLHWTPQLGILDVIVGMFNGVGLIEDFFLNMGVALSTARWAAYATVPLSMFLTFFIAALYDLRDDL